jgi:type II secretory pathway component PulF
MARFIYEAKTSPKDVIKGTLVADNKSAAIQKISRMGYYLLSLEEEAESLNRSKSYSTYFSDKISVKNITDFTRQLSDLLEAGITIAKALDILHSQTQKSDPGYPGPLRRRQSSVRRAHEAPQSIFKSVYEHGQERGDRRHAR